MKKLLALFAVVSLVALSGCSVFDGSSHPSSDAQSAVTCTYTTSGTASRTVSPPPNTGVSNTGTTKAVLSLNGDPVGLTLLNDQAPCAVNSFVSLAKQGFYDKTSCHRLGNTEGFRMLQCGDPTGTGTGGPGYTFAEELHGNETYPAGTLAMARTSAPSSQGSQFFLVFGDTQLDPDYTVFGTIDAAGLKVLKTLAAGGTDNSEGTGVGKPKLPAVIESVTLG